MRRRVRGRRVPVALGILGAALACAGSTESPGLEQVLADRAAGVVGFSPDASVVVVDAGSPEKAWQELVRIRGEGPSPVSRQLGEAFAESRGERRDIVVGGPHGPLNERILLDAFSLSRAPTLPGLRILLVSPEPASDALRAAAQELHVELFYRPLPESPDAS